MARLNFSSLLMLLLLLLVRAATALFRSTTHSVLMLLNLAIVEPPQITLLSVLLPPNGPIQSRSQEHNGNLPSQEGHGGGEKTDEATCKKKKQKSSREKSLHV